MIDDYPLLFDQCKYIDCGIGWYKIIEDLCCKIHEEIAKQPPLGEETYSYYPCVAQVKEKFGTLRFYMFSETDEISKLIQEAERLSSITCEKCGDPGKITGKHWYATLCDRCEVNSGMDR